MNFKYDKNHEVIFTKQDACSKLMFKRLWSNHGDDGAYRDLEPFINPLMQKQFLERCGMLNDFEHMSLQDFSTKLKDWVLHCGYPREYVEKQGIMGLVLLEPPPFHEVFQKEKQGILENFIQILDETDGLPMLKYVENLLKLSYFKDYYQDMLDDTLVVMVQQGFSSVGDNVKTLLKLGLNPENYILVTKPHTTCNANHEMFSTLALEKHFHYISTPLGESEPWNEAAREVLVSEVVEKVQHILKERPNIKKVVYYDEGATLARSKQFIKICIEDLKGTHQICMSEHTISGIDEREKNLPHIDVLMMARSWLKTQYEPFLIAETAYQASKPYLQDLADSHQTLRIGLIGCGRIGSEFARFLIDFSANQSNKSIILQISDIQLKDDLKNELSHYAQSKSVEVEFLSNKEDNQSLFEQSDIVFGATGKNITEGLKQKTTPRATPVILASISSGTREFASVCEQMPAQGEYVDYLGHRFQLLNKGHPMNFQRGQTDAVEPQKIQLIRALSVATVLLQLMHLKTNSDMASAGQNAEQYHSLRIDAFLQYMLWYGFKNYCKRTRSLTLPERIIGQCPSLNEMMSHGSKDSAPLLLSHQVPHVGNKFADYDKNHQSHILLRDDGTWSFGFLKDGNWLFDYEMLTKHTEKLGLEIKKFYFYQVFEQIMLLHQSLALYSIRACESNCLVFFQDILACLTPNASSEALTP